MDDSVEGTFDVDVVGLTDLVEFKSDAELFDFESGGEFGLFGDDDGTLHQHSSLSIGESDSYTNGSSSHLTPQAMNKLPVQKITKKPRKPKVWNEMEKDLFLKGLELFGQNWRKISKFIATKTVAQVKIYHKEWSATANVIPESVNVANDSSIYLPLGNHDKTFIMPRFSGSAEDGACNDNAFKVRSSYSNDLTNIHARSSEADSAISGISFGEGIVVSPLHDWDLGSQVSVSGIEEDSPPVFGRRNIRERRVPKTYTSRKRNYKSSKTCKNRKENCVKYTPRKALPSQAKKRNLESISQNIISPRTVINPMTFNEGQIVRLNKNESEDSDVNIDDSDEDITPLNDEDRVNNLEEDRIKRRALLCESENTSENKIYEKDECDSLSDDEKLFYLGLYQSVEEMSRIKYKSIRDRIICAWEKQKPVILTKEQVFAELKPICSELVFKIYNYLCLHLFINNTCSPSSLESQCVNDSKSVKRVLRARKLGKAKKDLLNNEKLCHDVIQKGGGMTISHDASGAVIEALHVPELNGRAQESKQPTTQSHVKLLNLLTHDPDSSPPFSLIVYPQALITLDLHSHSSYAEVIGLLGGFLDQRKQTLHITSAVPTNSSSSGIHCEMCPVSQIEAVETIRKSEKEVVGWYHSHPFFRPNPSQRDLDTQAHLQNWFKRNCSPFVGVIISSFCPSSNSESSEIRCFILDSPPSQHSKDLQKELPDLDVPYRLQWTVQNETELKWEEIERSVEDVLQKSREQPNAIEWKTESKNGASYLDKFVASLRLLLPGSMKELVNFIKDFVIEF